MSIDIFENWICKRMEHYHNNKSHYFFTEGVQMHYRHRGPDNGLVQDGDNVVWLKSQDT